MQSLHIFYFKKRDLHRRPANFFYLNVKFRFYFATVFDFAVVNILFAFQDFNILKGLYTLRKKQYY